MAWAILAILFVGCNVNPENHRRQAVKGLLKAQPDDVHLELDRLAEQGPSILPHLEQELHGAEPESRLRLLKALRRINDPEAVDFLKFIVRWDPNLSVRKEARLALKALPKTRR